MQNCQHSHSPGLGGGEWGQLSGGAEAITEAEGAASAQDHSDINQGSEGPRTRAAPNARASVSRAQAGKMVREAGAAAKRSQGAHTDLLLAP